MILSFIFFQVISAEIDPDLQFLSLSDLSCLQSRSDGIFVEHVETDAKIYTYHGWQYQNGDKSYVYYTTSIDKRAVMHDVKISTLLLKGYFPNRSKILDIGALEEFTDSEKTRIKLFQIQSDIGLNYLKTQLQGIDSSSFSCDDVEYNAHYNNSSKVNICYTTDGNAVKSVTLKNLMNRGYPKRDVYIAPSVPEPLRNYRFYLWRFMGHLIRKKYGRDGVRQFRNDTSTLLSDDEFENMLRKVNEDIRKHYKEYHKYFRLYAGPQCAADRLNRERLGYNFEFWYFGFNAEPWNGRGQKLKKPNPKYEPFVPL